VSAIKDWFRDWTDENSSHKIALFVGLPIAITGLSLSHHEALAGVPDTTPPVPTALQTYTTALQQ